MKQLSLLVLGIILLSSVGAQSQKITGTLLPKAGKPITVSPTGIAGLDEVKLNDSKPNANNGFIFNKPIVQGQNNGSTTTTPSNNATNPKPTVQLSSTPGQTIPSANEPLKYEEPPVAGSASTNTDNSGSNPTAIKDQSTLVYGPPPSSFGTNNSASTNNSSSTNLKSPNIQGTYKAEKNQPIVLVPLSAEDVENAKQKAKQKIDAVNETTKTPETVKSVADLYPPLNYGPPPSAASANLKSPKIQGAYVASKNNPYILMPLPLDAISGNSDVQNNNNTYNQPQTNTQVATDNQSPSFQKFKQGTDFNPATIPSTDSKFKAGTDFTPTTKTKYQYKSAQPIRQSTVNPAASAFQTGTDVTTTKATVYNGKYKKPVKQAAIKQPKSNNKFQKPIKQTTDNSITETAASAKTEDNTANNDNNQQPSSNVKTDYKFYLTPNGKYNVAFDALGSNVSVTSFGRVSDFTLPSNGTNTKPTYNYRGLLDGVGNLPLQYTYEGRVASVGATQLSYNYDGAIDKVGNTPIYYNANGTVDKIGNNKITYDYNGNIVNMDKSPMILVKQ